MRSFALCSSLPSCQLTPRLAILIALGNALPLVVEFLAARQSDLKLGEPTLEEERQRHDRGAFLLRLRTQFLYLPGMQQQLALAQRLDVESVAQFIGRDVHVVQPDLVVLHTAEGV